MFLYSILSHIQPQFQRTNTSYPLGLLSSGVTLSEINMYDKPCAITGRESSKFRFFVSESSDYGLIRKII